MNRQGSCTKPHQQQFELNIGPDGELRFIFNDALQPFLDLGDADIRRASNVEPVETVWFADLNPVGGPVIGPFRLRSEALSAESVWLLEHGIPTPNRTL